MTNEEHKEIIEPIRIGEFIDDLRKESRRIIGCSLIGTTLGVSAAFLLPEVFTARTVIIPPQQQGSSSAAAALGSLGALAGITGGMVKNSADQYVSFMYGSTVMDKVIDKFNLVEAYNEKFLADTRKRLEKNVAIAPGKKDGLITIEVSDTSPQRASEIANYYVEALRELTNSLAVTEAQQRRVFFEKLLIESKDKLTKAQIDLQGSGFNSEALKAEPKSAAEGYAKLKASLTAEEVKYESMRRLLAESTPEVMQQRAIIGSLRGEIARIESSERNSGEKNGSGYISRYREFKYQETLFELFSRQYEVARVDESREGGMIQVVDKATPPEKKSKPNRPVIIGLGLLAGFALGALAAVIKALGRNASATRKNGLG